MSNNKKKAPSKKPANQAAKQPVELKDTKKTDVVAETAKPKEKTAAAKSSKQVKKKPNKIVKYFKDLKGEIKKVVWPSFNKVVNNTTVVVVAMTVCGLVIWGIDSGLVKLLSLALGSQKG